VVLTIVGVTALAVGITLTLLRTGWGGDLALRLALPRVNGAIAGNLQAGRFRFGGDHLSLSDVVLRDPEGEVVARVRGIDVAFSPLALFSKHVRVRRLNVAAPALFLRQDARGLNLARALGPRKPAAAATSVAPPARTTGGLTVDLSEVRVSDGTIDFQSSPSGGAPPVALSGLAIGATAHYEAGPVAFNATVDVTAAARQPLQGPIVLHVSGQGSGDARTVDLRASIADAAVEAALRTTSATAATLRVSRLHVTPQVVHAFAPVVPLLIPVNVTAQASRDADTLTFEANLKSGAGALTASGTVDTRTASAHPFAVTARDLDLGRLLAGWPRTGLSVDVTGAGSGHALTDVTGELTLDMPAGRVAATPVGPVALRLKAERGQFEVVQLRAALPGLGVVAHGPAGPERMALEIVVDARDLGLTSRTFAAFPGWPLPPITGRGRIDATLSRTTDLPAAVVMATFPALTVAQNSVRGLSLTARIPNARAPQIGGAELKIAEARVGGHTLEGVTAHVQLTAHRLDADVHLGGAEPLTLTSGGTWGPDRASFALDRLTVRYPEATWTLVGQTRLAWHDEDLAVTGLSLRAGPQQLQASMSKRGARLHAKLNLQHLDLGLLPPVALPPNLTLGGTLDVSAALDGTSAAPEARATVDLRDGRVGRYRELSLQLDGRYGGGRAVGRVNAKGLESAIDARFDVPTVWPLRNARGPLTLDLTIPETDVARVLAALQLPMKHRIVGKVGVELHLHGTAAAPVLALDASTHALAVDDQLVGDLALHVAGDAGSPVTVGLNVQTPHALPVTHGPGDARALPLLGVGALQMRGDLSLASLVQGIPDRAQLMRTHFAVTGELQQVPLAALARAARSHALTGGVASLRVDVAGSALAPTGALNVQTTGAAGPRFPATDARLDAAFGARDTRLAVRVLRNGRELGSASGILELPSRRLADGAALVTAPLSMTVAVGPLRLSRAGLPGSVELGESNVLSTDLRAGLSVKGSLAHPRLTLAADLTNGKLGKKSLGSAHLSVDYRAQRADAELRIQAPTGELHLTSTTAIDLGYPQVTRSLDVDKIALDAKLTAQQFDLALLSGVTKDVRRVGGLLSMNITARGTVRAPVVQGQLEWTKGALTLTGLGDYFNVHLKAHGDQNAIWLDDLSLASGDGNAHVTASAARRANQSYHIKTNVSLRQFPIYGQGQVLARVSADGSVTGTASSQAVQAAARLSEAHVELTDAKQKDLQPLGRPSDVVLMERGKPLDRAEAAKLAALAKEVGGRLSVEVADGDDAVPMAAKASGLVAHLAIQAPRNLWMRGKDASIELGLGPDFHVESSSGPPQIYGQVIVKRGRIDVLGRRFDLQAGSVVQFIGPPGAPNLDVNATYFNETENITVMLAAKGTLDHLAISVSSPERPDLTEGQLYTLIVTGRLQLGGNTAGSTGASGEAASLVGGIVAAQLQKTLAKNLPLDVLTLQAGEGLNGSRLEAGTYLTRKLYAGYVGRVGANPALLQNRNAVHLEYQLSRRWSFDGEYGDVGTGTADLLWTKNY
jgi:translocation and assembly module TamB